MHWKRLFVLALMAVALVPLVPLVLAQTPEHKNPEQKDLILLKSRHFTPKEGISAGLFEVMDSATNPRVYSLMQFNQMPSKAEKKALESQGVKFLAYVPNNTWYVSIPKDKANQLAGKDLVRSMDRIAFGDKLAPGLNLSGNKLLDVVIEFHEDVSLGKAEKITREYGSVSGRVYSLNALVASIPANKLRKLALKGEVQWIEEAQQIQTFLDQARSVIKADIVQAPSYNLNGEGINVFVYDKGFVDDIHPVFVGRVTTFGSGQTGDHATNVGGAVAAGDYYGDANYIGVAPAVQIISASFDGKDSSDMEADYNQAINSYNIDVANNSWGQILRSSIGGPCDPRYTQLDELFDGIVRGSLGRPIPIVFGAGNGRGPGGCSNDYSSLGFPGTAKNVITVGATYSNWPATDYETTFTSFGPTSDGRLKPDVMAPGDQQDGDQGIKTSSATVWIDEYNNTTWRKGPDGLDDQVFPYFSVRGTSLSAPQVTGLVALMIQKFSSLYSYTPLPSTVKGILIHSAKDIESTGPDYATGYGLIDANKAVNEINDMTFKEEEIGDSFEEDEYSVYVPAGETQLKVTLVWDDPPAQPYPDKALVNDLDLVLVDPSSGEHHPWVLDANNPSNPATTGTDSVNNVEQVVVTSPSPGTWKIKVIGTSIAIAPQKYTLVTKYFGSFGDGGPGNELLWNKSLDPSSKYAYSFGDIDNDGDLDIYVRAYSVYAEMYENINGTISTSSFWNTGQVTKGGYSAFGDINGDGYLDLVILNGSPIPTKIYWNNGGSLQSPGEGINNSAYNARNITLGDVDNDGDLDLAVVNDGYFGDGNNFVYENVDGSIGTNVLWDSMLDERDRAVAFCDFDNDGDLDLLTGVYTDNLSNGSARVYENIAGTLTQNILWELGRNRLSYAACGDVDNDGDLDLVVNKWEGETVIYENVGGTLTNNRIATTPASYFAAFADVDNDGDLDFAVLEGGYGVVYENVGGEITSNIVWKKAATELFFGDVDNDGDLDIGVGGGKIYRNFESESGNPNSTPQPPASFNASYGGGQLNLSWDSGFDVETPVQSLYYNLRIGTSPGANDIVSGIYGQNGENGYYGNGTGRIGQTARVLSVPYQAYYWAVQTIDSSFKASAWSTEQMFLASNTVPTISGLPDQNIVEDSGLNARLIDLWAYASDTETADENLSFTIVSETDSNVVDCSIETNRYIGCVTGQSNTGSSVVTVRVSDGQLEATGSFTVTVSSVNDSPVLNPLPDQSLDMNTGYNPQLLDLTQYSFDVDSVVTFSVIDQNDTGLVDCVIVGDYLECDVQPDQNGYASVTIRVDDGSTTSDQTIIIAVGTFNDPPTIDSYSPTTNNIEINEGESQSFSVTVSDPENDPLTINWYAGEDLVGSGASYLFDANYTSAGAYYITAVVSDGELTDSRLWKLKVLNVNLPPAVYDIPDVNFLEDTIDSSIDLDNYVDPVDGDPITWSYTGNNNISISVDSNNVVTFTSPLEWSGSETITFTASDPYDLNDSNSLLVTVLPVNDNPTATITSYPSGTGYSNLDDLNFSGTGSDVEDSNVALEWRSDIDGNLGTGENISVRLSPGTHTITLAAIDSNGAEGIDMVSVSVCIIPENNLVVKAAAEFCYSGVDYNITDPDEDGVIVIDSNNASVDCKGSRLIGNGIGKAIYGSGFLPQEWYDKVLGDENKWGDENIQVLVDDENNIYQDIRFLDNITVKNCEIYYYNWAMDLRFMSNSLIKDNTVHDSNIGLVFIGEDSEISYNTVYDNNGMGLGVGGWTNTVKHNTAYGNNFLGIGVVGRGNVVSNNDSYNNDNGMGVSGYDMEAFNNNVTGNNHNGFSCVFCEDPYIHHNNVSDNNHWGLSILSSQGAIVSDNNTNNNKRGIHIGAMIFVSGSASGHQIINNTAKDNSQAGIAMSDSVFIIFKAGYKINDTNVFGNDLNNPAPSYDFGIVDFYKLAIFGGITVSGPNDISGNYIYGNNFFGGGVYRKANNSFCVNGQGNYYDVNGSIVEQDC